MHISKALLIILLALAASAPLHATTVTYCVGNGSEFDAMLAAVHNEVAWTADLDIRLRPGTYSSNTDPTGGTGIYIYAKFAQDYTLTYTLRLSGGWNAGCTVQAAPGGPATVIDALGTRTTLYTDVVEGANRDNVFVNVNINQLEFYRNNGDTHNAVHVNTPNGDLQLSYCKFRNGGGRALYVSKNLTFTMHNCLFEGNVVSSSANSDLVRAETNLTSAIFNNTFRDNTIPAPAFGDSALIKLGAAYTNGIGVAAFENNIVASNALCATYCYLLEVDGLGTIKYDLMNLAKVLGTPLSSLNNVSGSALFVHATGAEIRAGSPAQDKGRTTAVTNLPFDIAGSDRVQGEEVDIGAFEIDPNLIFSDGFE
jgi:hypothetical protein